MTVREAFKPYIDDHGLVQPGLGRGSNNGILFTAEYYITLLKAGELTPEDKKTFESIMDACQPEPGLTNRQPPNTPHDDQEGLDDYIGLLAAAFLLGSDIGTEVLDYGKRNHSPYGLQFYYNNVWPGTHKYKPGDNRTNWSAWLGRFPGFVAHAYLCGGEVPPFLYQLGWAATIKFSPKPENQDSYILSWLMVVAYDAFPKKSFFMTRAANSFKQNLRKNFPGGIREVFSKYFEPNHPLGIYGQD